MRGAATSDLHLGFRAFSAMIDGRNAREVDVERAWAQAVDRICEAGPDFVGIPGDVFHHPRVGIHSVKAWRNGILRIVEETEAEIVIVQGNHDAAKTSETLSPIVIPDDYARVHILTEPGRVRFETSTGEKVAVACFPFVKLGQEFSYKLEPADDADTNILLLHAAVKTSVDGKALPHFYGGAGALDMGREADRWDAIIVGDYHEYTQLVPDRIVLYPGSLERTSSNIWNEHDPKGLVFFDTANQTHEFVTVSTREMVDHVFRSNEEEDEDYVYIDAIDAESVNSELLRLLDGGYIPEDSIFRVKVDNFPRGDRDQIDWKLVRELKAHCLHFYLDLRYAERTATDLGDRRDGAGRSLRDEAVAFLEEDPPEVRDCAMGYLFPPEEETEEVPA